MNRKASFTLTIAAFLVTALSTPHGLGLLIGASAGQAEARAEANAPHAPAQETTCLSCADCRNKLISGSYVTVTLTADLIDVGGSCVSLLLGESNVVFDCAGHTIDGDGIDIDPEQGIAMLHGTNNTIMNCVVSDFSSGIYLANATRHTVVNNTTTSNGVGIDLGSASDNTIHRNHANENYTGIRLQDADNNTLYLNVACDNTVLDVNLDYNSTGNTGAYNTCSNPDGWNDYGATGCTMGCDWQRIYLPTVLGSVEP